MFECSSLVSCCNLSGIMLLIADYAIHVLLVNCKPCIRFRWSLYRFPPKSSHLSSGILGFPTSCLVHLFPSEVPICIAHHILHYMPCLASCCLCIAPWVIVVPLLVFLIWVELGDEFVNEEHVEYANEDRAFDNSVNFAGKMTITLNITSIFAC